MSSNVVSRRDNQPTDVSPDLSPSLPEQEAGQAQPPDHETYVTSSYSTPRHHRHASSTTHSTTGSPLGQQLKRPLTISDSLSHQFSVVNTQVGSGLALLKRTAEYIGKVSHLMWDFSLGILKCTQQEQQKPTKVEADGMTEFSKLHRTVQDLFIHEAQRQCKFVQKVRSKVTEPLLRFHKQAEAQRKALVDQERQVTVNLKENRNQVEKAKLDCMKVWRDLKEVFAEFAAEDPSSSRFAKLTAKYSKRRVAVRTAFTSYHRLTQQANLKQDEYYQRGIARIMTKLESLETQRMDRLSQLLGTFAALSSEMVAPLRVTTDTLIQAIADVSTEKELARWLEEQVNMYGSPAKPEPFAYDLPCPLQVVNEEDDWSKYIYADESPRDAVSALQRFRFGNSPPHHGSAPSSDISEDAHTGPVPPLDSHISPSTATRSVRGGASKYNARVTEGEESTASLADRPAALPRRMREVEALKTGMSKNVDTKPTDDAMQAIATLPQRMLSGTARTRPPGSSASSTNRDAMTTILASASALLSSSSSSTSSTVTSSFSSGQSLESSHRKLSVEALIQNVIEKSRTPPRRSPSPPVSSASQASTASPAVTSPGVSFPRVMNPYRPTSILASPPAQTRSGDVNSSAQSIHSLLEQHRRTPSPTPPADTFVLHSEHLMSALQSAALTHTSGSERDRALEVDMAAALQSLQTLRDLPNSPLIFRSQSQESNSSNATDTKDLSSIATAASNTQSILNILNPNSDSALLDRILATVQSPESMRAWVTKKRQLAAQRLRSEPNSPNLIPLPGLGARSVSDLILAQTLTGTSPAQSQQLASALTSLDIKDIKERVQARQKVDGSPALTSMGSTPPSATGLSFTSANISSSPSVATLVTAGSTALSSTAVASLKQPKQSRAEMHANNTNWTWDPSIENMKVIVGSEGSSPCALHESSPDSDMGELSGKPRPGLSSLSTFSRHERDEKLLKLIASTGSTSMPSNSNTPSKPKIHLSSSGITPARPSTTTTPSQTPGADTPASSGSSDTSSRTDTPHRQTVPGRSPRKRSQKHKSKADRKLTFDKLPVTESQEASSDEVTTSTVASGGNASNGAEEAGEDDDEQEIPINVSHSPDSSSILRNYPPVTLGTSNSTTRPTRLRAASSESYSSTEQWLNSGTSPTAVSSTGTASNTASNVSSPAASDRRNNEARDNLSVDTPGSAATSPQPSPAHHISVFAQVSPSQTAVQRSPRVAASGQTSPASGTNKTSPSSLTSSLRTINRVPSTQPSPTAPSSQTFFASSQLPIKPIAVLPENKDIPIRSPAKAISRAPHIRTKSEAVDRASAVPVAKPKRRQASGDSVSSSSPDITSPPRRSPPSAEPLSPSSPMLSPSATAMLSTTPKSFKIRGSMRHAIIGDYVGADPNANIELYTVKRLCERQELPAAYSSPNGKSSPETPEPHPGNLASWAELPYEKGDMVLVTAKPHPSWWIGKLIMPSFFQSVVEGRVWVADFVEESVVGSPVAATPLRPSPDMTLKQLIQLPLGLEFFQRYLQAEFSEENLLFWFEARAFRRLDKRDPHLLERAIAIRDRFIDAGASEQVNIKGPAQQRLLKQIASGQVSIDLFDETATEIVGLMCLDSFSRFKTSPLFTQFLKAVSLSSLPSSALPPPYPVVFSAAAPSARPIPPVSSRQTVVTTASAAANSDQSQTSSRASIIPTSSALPRLTNNHPTRARGLVTATSAFEASVSANARPKTLPPINASSNSRRSASLSRSSAVNKQGAPKQKL